MDVATIPDSATTDPAATIARQQAEIERLERRIAEDRFAQDLRDALATSSTTGEIGAPVGYRQLLKMITGTAADIVDARAGTLFLVDATQEHLVFEAAVGDNVVESEKFRMPIGQGIAGLVAQTGQPIAVSDTPEDDLDADDIGHAIGFNPKHILCMPLSFRDQVIGVLQFLDKENDESFSVDDMEDVGLFAHLAAVAIEQARTQSRMGALVSELIENLDGIPDYDRYGLTEKARAFTADLGQQTGYLDSLELARLLQEIVHYGEDAALACKGLLTNFAEFLRAREGSSDRGGPRW